MKKRRLKLLVVLLVITTPIWSQSNRLSFDWKSGPQVIMSSDTLKYAFMGGVDLPQYSRVDLNLDGIEDLVIFDRQGSRWLTFLAENNEWVAAPSYADSLPKVEHWGLFRDYNGDGRKDLFAFVLGGIGVWENNSIDSIQFDWALSTNYLTTNVGTSSPNLYNFSSDIPAIDDIDDDGDLDILTFGQRSTIEWHEGLTPNGLDFAMNTTCWGRFEENLASNKLALDACQGIQKMEFSQKTSGGAHAGSTILTLNLNGDTLTDALLGDVSFTNLVAAYNGGRTDSAFIGFQDTLYPSNIPTNIEYFPAAFYEDVDFDGVEDLIVGPNLNGSINQGNSWFYKNTGVTDQPVFSTLDSSFLTSYMIDLGTTARPALADLDFDGDYDLVVGGKGAYLAPGTYKSSLFLFNNIGTNTQPSFELANSDFALAGFNNLGEDLSPTFGDLDGDYDPDMLIGAVNGQIYFYENTGTITNPSFTYRGSLQNIDVGNHSTPSLGDLDGDGDLDLIIGNEAGTVAYYEHTGNFPNFFTLVDDKWVGIDMSTNFSPSGYSAPAILYGNDTTLIVGSEDQGIVQLDSLRQIMNGAINLDLVFGNGGNASTTREGTPFSGSKRNGRMQIIFSKDELLGKGAKYGQIGSIGFEIGSNTSLYLTQGFTISMKHISDTSLTGFQSAGFTQVYEGIRVLTTGWNDIQLNTPFQWNSVDHILIEICFSKHAQTGDIPVIYGNTPFRSVLIGDINGWNSITANGCQMPYLSKNKNRPNIRFHFTPTLKQTDAHMLSSGNRLHPAIADLNADGFPDMIVGNMSGGLHYFEGKAFNNIDAVENELTAEFRILPNPSSGIVKFESNINSTIELYDLLGKRIGIYDTNVLQSLSLPKGMYVVRFQSSVNQALTTQKLIIQ